MGAPVRKGDLWLPEHEGVRVYRQMPKPGYGRVLPFRALNAVTFDSRFEKGATSGTSPFAYVSNAGTVTGTVGNNANRGLIAFACFRGTTAQVGTASMTWAGNAMTSIVTFDLSSAGTHFQLYLFGLHTDASITTGNQTISLAWSGAFNDSRVLGVVSLYSVDQTTGWQNSGNDSGTGTAPSSTVTSANGNMAVVGHCSHDASSITINAGTSAWTDNSLQGTYAQAYRASTTTSTVVSWTLGSSVAWANVKIDVIAAAAAVFVPLVGRPGGHAGMPLAGGGGGLAG